MPQRLLSDAALVELLDAAPDGVLLVGEDGTVAFGNEAARALFGYTREELAGLPVDALVPPAARARHAAERRAYAARPRRRPMGVATELRGVRRDGSEFPVEISLAPLRTGGRTLIVSIVRDATEATAMQEERVRFARAQAVEEVVAGLEAIVWESRTPDRESLTFLGGRREAFLGYPREQWLRGAFWRSAVHPGDRLIALSFAETARERDSFDLEYRLIDAHGAIHQVREVISVKRGAHGEIERVRGVIVDRTARAQVDERLSQAQKMEAIGQLAGGVAHDFNNLLTIVSGYARRLRARAELSAAHAELEQIIAATDRAADLTRQLLAFARRSPGEPALIDVNATIRELEPLLARVLDADIALALELQELLPPVLIERTALDQILMNLIINASDAMRGRGRGGVVTVATRTRTVSAAEAREHGVQAGEDVRITVSDTGPGIPPELRERIFEPFFTTKGERGTGMGLATVYGIVEQAGGWIDLDSAAGVGTTFQVMLPAGAAVEDAARGAGELGTLLLVEDEPALRGLVVTMLREQGYQVLAAGNGIEAIELAERHRGPLDLLITDVVMPRLSGPELAQRLRGLRPGLEVLFMSGYNDSRLLSRGIEQAGVNLLVKPFTPEQLIARVGALAGAGGGG